MGWRGSGPAGLWPAGWMHLFIVCLATGGDQHTVPYRTVGVSGGADNIIAGSSTRRLVPSTVPYRRPRRCWMVLRRRPAVCYRTVGGYSIPYMYEYEYPAQTTGRRPGGEGLNQKVWGMARVWGLTTTRRGLTRGRFNQGLTTLACVSGTLATVRVLYEYSGSILSAASQYEYNTKGSRTTRGEEQHPP